MDSRLEDLAAVLRDARARLAASGRELSYSLLQDAKLAVRELDGSLAKLARGELPRGASLRALFAAAGPLDEIATGGGWTAEWTTLHARFDAAIARAYGDAE